MQASVSGQLPEEVLVNPHKEVDLAPHPVVGPVLQVGDMEKFPHARRFESLDPFFEKHTYTLDPTKSKWADYVAL